MADCASITKYAIMTGMFKKKKKHKKQDEAVAQNVQLIYDALMGEIEIEITSGMIPLLGEIYEDETKDETKDRKEHYKWAFEQLFSMWDEFVEGAQEYIGKIEEKAFSSSKEKTKSEDASALKSIQKQIENT